MHYDYEGKTYWTRNDIVPNDIIRGRIHEMTSKQSVARYHQLRAEQARLRTKISEQSFSTAKRVGKIFWGFTTFAAIRSFIALGNVDFSAFTTWAFSAALLTVPSLILTETLYHNIHNAKMKAMARGEFQGEAQRSFITLGSEIRELRTNLEKYLNNLNDEGGPNEPYQMNPVIPGNPRTHLIPEPLHSSRNF